MHWYYYIAGKKCGPVPREVLVRYIAIGNLPHDILVWKEGMENWVAADQVPELALPEGEKIQKKPPVQPRQNVDPRKRHRSDSRPHRQGPPLAVWIVLGLAALGILFMSWKEMKKSLPPFEELNSTIVNSYQINATKRILNDGSDGYSVEFTDHQGKRYQASDFGSEAWARIDLALKENRPLTARYGEWDAAVTSDTIFTIYQLEAGNEILISYKKMAEAKDLESRNAPWIMLTILVAGGIAVFVGIRYLAPLFARMRK